MRIPLLAAGAAATLALMALLLLPSGAETAFPGANGRIVFESGGDDDIWSVNPDGSGLLQLTGGISYDESPQFSPDGSRVLFTRDLGGALDYEIMVINADGTGLMNLTNSAGGDETGGWSPDGSLIAFTSNRDGNREIYVMNAQGGNQTRLTNSAQNEDDPRWSPDGSKIAFARAPDIWVMNADGTNEVNLTAASPKANFYPDWSPDGTKIAFTSNRSGVDVWIMNADGSGEMQITTFAGSDGEPAWSPEGDRIVFYRQLSASPSETQLFTMKPDGSDEQQLTTGPGMDNNNPDWGPLAATPTPTESPSPSPTATPTGTASATPTPTATATPGGTPHPSLISPSPPLSESATPTLPASQTVAWGNNDCRGGIDSVDALIGLQFVAFLPYTQDSPCPIMGNEFNISVAGLGALRWGDVNCDSGVDSVDALAVLRHVAHLPATPIPACPELDEQVVAEELPAP